MNDTTVEQIVRAVLYEGYILYPYRPSVKTHQRWTFGGIYPRAYSEAQGGTDACTMQAQCLVTIDENAAAVVNVTLRFLHLTARTVETLDTSDTSAKPAWRPVDAVEIDGRHYQSWQEAVERRIGLPEVRLAFVADAPWRRSFAFPACHDVQPLLDADGHERGRIVRAQQPLQGMLELSADALAPGLFRLTARAVNNAPIVASAATSRDEAVMRSLLSSNIVLSVCGGAFVSPTDPPAELKARANDCENIGCWPVLVGAPGERGTVLCSPIILPDYPQVAPESPGDLFDGTEIDEILTLRILTLTDEEKRRAASVDAHAGAMLARTEALAREQLMNLHGTVRGLRPAAEMQGPEVRHA